MTVFIENYLMPILLLTVVLGWFQMGDELERFNMMIEAGRCYAIN